MTAQGPPGRAVGALPKFFDLPSNTYDEFPPESGQPETGPERHPRVLHEFAGDTDVEQNDTVDQR